MLSHVTHHSAILPPSMRNIAPKSNFTFCPEAGNGPIVCVVSGGNIDLSKFSELVAS